MKIGITDDIEQYKKGLVDHMPEDTRGIIFGCAIGFGVTLLGLQLGVKMDVNIAFLIAALAFGVPMYLFGFKATGTDMSNFSYMIQNMYMSKDTKGIELETPEMRAAKEDRKRLVQEYVDSHYSNNARIKFNKAGGVESKAQVAAVWAKMEKAGGKKTSGTSKKAKTKAVKEERLPKERKEKKISKQKKSKPVRGRGRNKNVQEDED